MKKLFLGILAVFLLVVSGANATVTIDSITPISAIEDTLTAFDLTTSGVVNGIPVYVLEDGPSGMTINSATGDLTWTPTNDNVGSNSVTVRADDNDGAGIPYVGSINVVNVNDAPVITAIGNKEVYDEFTLEFTVLATDVDAGASLIYSATGLPEGASFDVTTQIFSWTPTDDQWDTYEDIEFRVSDGVLENSENITITVDPAYCDEDEWNNYIEIGDIDFDDDEYKIGDFVDVNVEDVEATVEDLEDVEVEVCLYNVDEAKIVDDCWEVDERYDIDEDDKEDYEIEFKIPNSEDIGKKDDYKLIVYVTADDEDGDSQCIQDSEEIEIERETHDVIIKSVELSPSVVKAGETVQVTVEVENIGTKDEDDTYVVLKESVLGINLESTKFDLEDYTDSDNDHTVRFIINIPENAKAQDYELAPKVYFDDGDETNDGFVTLTVEKTTVVEPKDVLSVSSTTTTINASDGKDVSLHLMLTNNEANDLDATVELSAIGTWAEDIAPEAISLHPGANNIYLPLTLKEVSEGKYTATVTVKPVGVSEFDVKQTTLSFDVSGDLEGEGLTGITGGFAGVKGSSIFWIIGDIVLVIIALFFIKAIFFGSRKTE